MAPRFAQAITGTLCLEAILFDQPAAVAVALALVVASLVAPRWSPVGWLFRLVARPPQEMEPAAPTRFSQVLAVIFLSLSLVLLAAGQTTLGWIVAGMVTVLALLSATTGICVGCEIYRFALARRGGDQSDDLRGELGLDGQGPWLVVLTAPGCARCEPAARELEQVAGTSVTRVDLARRPQAARLPVRSVPAALAVAADGSLRAVRAGRLGRDDLTAVAQAV
jgi:hypothetical protein